MLKTTSALLFAITLPAAALAQAQTQPAPGQQPPAPPRVQQPAAPAQPAQPTAPRVQQAPAQQPAPRVQQAPAQAQPAAPATQPPRVQQTPAQAQPAAPAAQPARPATPAPAAAPAAAPAQRTPQGQLVNLNTAPADELDKLPQIGAARAAAIIAKRPYRDWDDFVAKGVIPSNAEAAIKDKVRFR
jgi:DNA uptake protein ComE-like DNA-binding protein